MTRDVAWLLTEVRPFEHVFSTSSFPNYQLIELRFKTGKLTRDFFLELRFLHVSEFYVQCNR